MGSTAARGGAALAGGFVEHNSSGGGNVEGTDASGHGDAEQVVAGAADEVVETGAFAAEDENAVTGEVELVVVAGAALVEADDPEVLLFQLFEGADEVDDTGEAQVLGSAGAGFYGHGTERCGAAFSEHDAINAGAVGHAQQSAEILRVFDAVEGENEALGVGRKRDEEILNREQVLRANEGDNPLVSGGAGDLGELLARLLANADTGLAAGGDEAREAVVLALAGNENVIEAAAAGAEGFLDRVDTVENIHAASLRGGGELHEARTVFGCRAAGVAGYWGGCIQHGQKR